MITDSFDSSSFPLLTPDKIYRHKYIADICIVTFSIKVLEDVKKRYNIKVESYTGTTNGKINIYSFIHDNKKYLFYMSPIGSAISSTVLDEVRYITGAKRFIFFGSCGLLDKNITQDKIIIPESAYRDEGFSYHYKQASDFIKISNASKLIQFFNNLNIPYIKGKTWTTDAIYMETVKKVEQRKNEGCITVEMESAGLQSICDYRNIDLYIFFFTSDLLSTDVWTNISLGGEKEKIKQINCFEIALTFAQQLADEKKIASIPLL